MAKTRGKVGTSRFKAALSIQSGERDFALGLDRPSWPRPKNRIPEGWIKGQGYLSRTIYEDSKEKKAGQQLAQPIVESVLRFPSAPVHGLHRLHEYHVNEGKSENMHTYRVLTHPKQSKVRRIFLMHNGLNETQKMGLYYQLASYLIYEDRKRETVCILRPFPGHLTRSRFYGFAETPLDHYLWDGSHLFRQFLRYMIETQWLLSVIARRSSYRCISGLNLLAEEEDPDESRLDDLKLATEIKGQWDALHAASEEALPKAQKSSGDAAALRDPPEGIKPYLQAVKSVRGLLQLEDRHSGELNPDQEEPAIHVVGYSLGGFTAQSVFMSWPFLVSSCVTLLSGGALRELAPTAFADPEEWQTLLHSLRYELDESMMSGGYGREIGEAVAGIEPDLFLHLKSTFYEVFQQEYRGSFQSRLAAFRRRMLFVVGGNDPIVRPQSVLDSGPPDGMNMLTIGGLGHFLGAKARDEEETAQRSFWLPEVGRLIDKLADEAAAKQDEDRAENWLNSAMELPDGPKINKIPPRLDVAERLAVDRDGALPGPLFERCLDDLLARVDAKRGVLFILRNEVPTALLETKAIQEHAAALHHDDARIVRYINGLQRRRQLIEGNPKRISVILPWNAKRIMEGIDPASGHPSQAEGGGGQMPEHTEPKETWKEFSETCSRLSEVNSTYDAIRVFDGRAGISAGGKPALNAEALEQATRERFHLKEDGKPIQPSLPDCWIWMSPKFLLHDDENPVDIGAAREELCKVVPDRYLKDPDRLVTPLRKDLLRIITVSRARYNPRFRGRLIADPIAARDLLHHISICVLASVPYKDYELSADQPDFRPERNEPSTEEAQSSSGLA